MTLNPKTALAVCMLAISYLEPCLSQLIVVKSLKQGNAFLYSTQGYTHGGYIWGYESTTTILQDTIVADSVFHRLSTGTPEFSDSTKLIVLKGDIQQLVCDFSWSVGDTVNGSGMLWRVLGKGIDRVFSDSLPYIFLGNVNGAQQRRIFKKFGIVQDYTDNIINRINVLLIGARIDSVIYGQTSTMVSQRSERPNEMSVDAFPNPSHGSIRIQIDIQRASDLRVEIFNVLGQRVALIHEGTSNPGKNIYQWNGLDLHGQRLPSGVYFVRSSQLGNSIQRNVVLLK